MTVYVSLQNWWHCMTLHNSWHQCFTQFDKLMNDDFLWNTRKNKHLENFWGQIAHFSFALFYSFLEKWVFTWSSCKGDCFQNMDSAFVQSIRDTSKVVKCAVTHQSITMNFNRKFGCVIYHCSSLSCHKGRQLFSYHPSFLQICS